MGHAFQIADDLLDVTETSSRVGKGTGKDAGAGKHTYPGCVGIEASRKAARDAADDAVAALGDFGAAADDLRSLADFVGPGQRVASPAPRSDPASARSVVVPGTFGPRSFARPP